MRCILTNMTWDPNDFDLPHPGDRFLFDGEVYKVEQVSMGYMYQICGFCKKSETTRIFQYIQPVIGFGGRVAQPGHLVSVWSLKRGNGAYLVKNKTL